MHVEADLNDYEVGAVGELKLVGRTAAKVFNAELYTFRQPGGL